LKRILPLFSYIFHPIFIPVFGTLAYLSWNEHYFETPQQLLLLVQIVIITILIPISFFYLLKTLGRVDSVMVSDLSQRKIPLTIQLILIIIMIRESITIDRIPELFFFFVGGLVSTALILLLLFGKVKASIHMTGISALTIFVIGLSLHNGVNLLYYVALLLLLNGLIAASRLEMQAHSVKELAFGFFIGTIPQLLLWRGWL
jgi:hypothetical protein